MSHYPAFSQAEMRRRREALEALMDDVGVDHVIVYGADRSGSAVQWLTEWPVTREAAVVVGAGEQDALFVQFYNHLPLARQLAKSADVRWGGESTIAAAVDELCRRGGRHQRVGVIGPLPFTAGAVLAADTAEVVNLGPQYTRLRLVKSPEELDWMRAGARLSDAGMLTTTSSSSPPSAGPSEPSAAPSLASAPPACSWESPHAAATRVNAVNSASQTRRLGRPAEVVGCNIESPFCFNSGSSRPRAGNVWRAA
jgi:hypothetical protein